MNLGAYTLIRKIAEGGVADIYLAKTKAVLRQEKYLVCKCIRQNLAHDEEFLGSIINEAQCTTRLRHPNILEVFDLCACDANAFLAMEYLDAQDLSKLIIGNNARNETLPYVYAAYVIGQVALGLHAAHELTNAQGTPLRLVHRDVSPENILFGAGGEIKIGDFGIAKTVFMPDITPPDVIKGKFNYMSPEQAWADKIDRRSDIFSLAAVLYEATTGHCFYPSDSIESCIQCARMALYEPARSICPDYPPKLEEILAKALDLDKKCRYATALEFKIALDGFIASQNQTVAKDDWIAYLRPRVEFPDHPLPRLQAAEFVPDASSLLAHAHAGGAPGGNDAADPIATGQIGAEEIEQLRRKAIDMMSSEFSVLSHGSGLRRYPGGELAPTQSAAARAANDSGADAVSDSGETQRMSQPPKDALFAAQIPLPESSETTVRTRHVLSQQDTLPRIDPAVRIEAPKPLPPAMPEPTPARPRSGRKTKIIAAGAVLLLLAVIFAALRFARNCAF